MTEYILITPEIDADGLGRNIGKTFIAQAVVDKLRGRHKTVLHFDEDMVESEFITRNATVESLKQTCTGKSYDFIVLAGMTRDVENAFRILRRSFYPSNTKTIKLQNLS